MNHCIPWQGGNYNDAIKGANHDGLLITDHALLGFNDSQLPHFPAGRWIAWALHYAQHQ
jgi:hypothetical protein